jgi:hypothetical protein
MLNPVSDEWLLPHLRRRRVVLDDDALALFLRRLDKRSLSGFATTGSTSLHSPAGLLLFLLSLPLVEIICLASSLLFPEMKKL